MKKKMFATKKDPNIFIIGRVMRVFRNWPISGQFKKSQKSFPFFELGFNFFHTSIKLVPFQNLFYEKGPKITPSSFSIGGAPEVGNDRVSTDIVNNVGAI